MLLYLIAALSKYNNMENYKEYFDTNKVLWDKRTEAHITSDFYDMPAFVKGRNSLNKFELDLLGELKGKKILHLQCHFGQDSISLAKMGAEVTALDFSEESIAQARAIADKMGTSVNFVCCNVLEMDQYIEEKFDIVFASYGICGWLPELSKWGALIAERLAPKGRFILVDFHPVIWMFDDNFEKISYSYFNQGAIEELDENTYTDSSIAINKKSYWWNHSFSDIISALLNADLQLMQLKEFDHSPYECFKNMVKTEEGFQIRNMEGKMPLVYAMEYHKPRG